MKKIILGEPVIVSQNTTEPIMHGAWQNPVVRYNDGVLYVRFKGVKDSYENQDEKNKNPVFRSFDKGENWTEPSVFHDYGVLPRSTKMPDGTFLMTSGRPGVYLRACFDGKGEEWDDIIEIIKVPEEDKYTAYEQYTCCNNGICACDEKTAFLSYSNFQLNTPDGVRAKSIIVQKITISEE